MPEEKLLTPPSLYMLASKSFVVRCKTRVYPKKSAAGAFSPDSPTSAGHEIRILTIYSKGPQRTLAYATCACDAGCLDYSIVDFKFVETIPSIMRFLEGQVHDFGKVPTWLQDVDSVAVQLWGDSIAPSSVHSPALLLAYQDFQRRCRHELEITRHSTRTTEREALVQLSNRLLGFREKHTAIAARSGAFI